MKYLARYRDGEKVYEEKDGIVLLDFRSDSTRTHFIIGDIEPYESPIDGRVITSRAKRKDDLARHNCRPWEGRTAETAEIARQHAYLEAKSDARMESALHQTLNHMSIRHQDALRRR